MSVAETRLSAMDQGLFKELLDMSNGKEGLLESDLGLARDTFIAEVELRDGIVYRTKNGYIKVFWMDDED